MLSIIVEPFKYDFFIRALVAAFLIGSLSGIIGVYVTTRGLSYIGHGLSHSLFGGAVVSNLLGINFYLGAGVWGIATSLLVNTLTSTRKIKADAAIGIITTASFALGVTLLSRAGNFTRNFEALLFGNILGITWLELYAIGAVFLLALLFVLLYYRPLLFVSFDKEGAQAYGINTILVDIGFFLILTATLVVSMGVLGVTLMSATIIIPASIARLLSIGFKHLLIYSVIIGTLVAVVGMYLSYFLDAPSGGTITLLGTIVFALTYLYNFLSHRHLHRHENIIHRHYHEHIDDHKHIHEK